MHEMRFDAGIGTLAMNVAQQGSFITKAMGSHCLQMQLEIHIPATLPATAGRLLVLETDLFVPMNVGPRGLLASVMRSVPFTVGSVERPTVEYLISTAQLMAMEKNRSGDLRLEMRVRAVLPQADGYPGANEGTIHISIAESDWRSQLAALGRAVAVEMEIPLPLTDEKRLQAADWLRDAQRRLGGNDIDGAMAMARKSLEYVEHNSGWGWPGSKKLKEQRTADERWAWIRSAVADQASGALHIDAGTKDYAYTRAEAETVIAIAAALLRIVP